MGYYFLPKKIDLDNVSLFFFLKKKGELGFRPIWLW